MGLALFFCGVAQEIVGNFDCQAGQHRKFGLPSLVAVNVGESNDIPACEDFEFVPELGFASGGEPYIGGHEGSADYGCLFGFD